MPKTNLPKLSRYMLDGRHRIDSNLVENAVRPLATVHKDCLFCDYATVAVGAAIGTNVESRIWMEDILTGMPQYDSERRTASNYSLETGENTTYTHFRCHHGVATDTVVINFANTGNLPEVYCDFRNSIKTGR